jgi:uncharacterized protein (TIGR04540 family)
MPYDFLQYPPTVKYMAQEINRITNDYYARKISNEQLRDCILFWATNSPELLFQGEDFKPTIKIISGQRRVELLNKLLAGYQIKMI